VAAHKGAKAIIPGSTSTRSSVVEGKGDPDALCSAPHGAGRMSSARSPTMRREMPPLGFFSHGGPLQSACYGDCLPERDFPALVDVSLQGRLPWEKFVTERIGIGDVENASHECRAQSWCWARTS
jgi:Zn-dependent alcohol dehydrogenase